MSSKNKIFFIIILAIIVLFVLFNWRKNANNSVSSSSIPKTTNSQKTKLQTKLNEQANVSVSVTPKVLESGKAPQFDVQFNTHSVNLSFNLSSIAFLRDDKGIIYKVSNWQGSQPGGHHRSGTLIFIEPLGKTKFVELVFKDIAGVSERVFRWDIN